MLLTWVQIIRYAAVYFQFFKLLQLLVVIVKVQVLVKNLFTSIFLCRQVALAKLVLPIATNTLASYGNNRVYVVLLNLH